MAKIHKIALFISHIYGEYQREVSQGVIDKATEFGYNVDIFVSNDEQILGSYASGEFGILQIPNPDAYDGAIVSSGTYLLPELGNQIVSSLQEWNCPVVEINTEGTPFPRVVINNNDRFIDLINHLHNDHNLDSISFLGNSNDWFFTNIREDIYKKSMSNLGLSSYVYMDKATLNETSIAQAVDNFIANETQAIVCYNDDFAIAVVAELANRGLSVPEDIAVTGCDNLEFGQKIDPNLTTLTFPLHEMGEQAFLLLLDQLDHGKLDENHEVVVKAEIKYGRSCGCKGCQQKSPIIYSNSLRQKVSILEGIYLQDMKMSSTFQGITEIDTAMDLLASFLMTIKHDQNVVGLKESYVCLYSNWNHIPNKISSMSMFDEEPEDDRIILKLALRNHSRLSECTFPKTDCLPEFVRKEGSEVFVFTPLFFGSKSFGYLCEAFENNVISYPFSFVSWLQNVNSMLQSIVDSRSMQLVMKKLEDVYSHDDLTGLYNLKKFNELTPLYIRTAARNASSITTIVMDLDHLKHINDSHGHAEGNFAIQVIGQAITQIINDNMIACRFGGDEFYLLGYGINRSETERIINKITRYLDNYNEMKVKPYRISASIGYELCSTYTEEAVTACFALADKKMYEQKAIRHKTFQAELNKQADAEG